MKKAILCTLLMAGFFLCMPILQADPPNTTDPNNPDHELLTLTLSLKTNATCFGANNGLAVVAAVGGLPPFVYVWSNGTLGPINANLSAGVYTVTATDLLGATAQMNVTITEPPQLQVNVAAQVDINCLHVNGSATVNTSGGTGASAIVWSNGQTGNTATGLSAGVYLATATDANGCVTVKPVTITADLQLPTVNINLNGDLQIDCNSPTVSLDASASTGGPNLLYLWTTVNGHIAAGANNDIATVDAAGTYQLKLTNNTNGCTNTQNVNVTADLTLPTVNVQAGAGVDLQLDCLTPDLMLSGQGSATGAGILYLWTTVNGHIVAGANTLDQVVVDAAGNYILHVTNTNNGCSNTDDATVTVNLTLPTALIAAGAGIDLQLDCLTPTLTLDASASTSGTGIGYLWTTLDGHIAAGANTTHPIVDAEGTYLLHITNGNNGCSASASVDVTADLNLPTVSASVNGQLGCSNSSLVIDATASSQGSNFLYLWTTLNGHIVTGANTLTPTVDAAGTYTLVVTNLLSGCTASTNVNVTGSPSLNVSVNGLVNVSCFGLLNGSVNLSVSGGTGPFTYLWSNGMTTASLSGLAAGLYIGTVTDAAGCQSIVNVTIGQPSQITTNVSTTPASGAGQSDGSASITTTGGTGPYTYQWSNGASGSSATGLSAGTYTVTISDATGCSITITIVVGNNASCSLGVNVTATKADCGQSNGSATAAPTGGSSNLTFKWSNGMTGATINGLAPGTYIVTVSDANGCTAVGAAIITSQDVTPPVVKTQDATLNLDASGNAALTISMINNGSFDACSNITLSLNVSLFSCTDIGAHVVILTATDQAGNSATATATVTVVDNTAPVLKCPDNIVVTTGNSVVHYDPPTMTDNCLTNLDDLTLVLTAGFSSGSVFPLGLTTVSYLGIMANGGGTATCDFTVDVSGGLTLTFDVHPPSCPGEADGSITVHVTGGSGNYTYIWTNANGQTGPTATGLKAGNYSVVVIDDLGNIGGTSVDLPDPTGLNISIAVITDNCTGAGSLDVTVTGGTPPYTYAWYDSNGSLIATTEDLDSIPSGGYTVVVTDASGCTFTSGVMTVNLVSGTVETELTDDGTVTLKPNPTFDGHVTLGLDLPQFSPIEVAMFNTNGQQVGGTLNANLQQGQMALNMASFTPGQYLVKVTTANKTYFKKVIRVE